MSCCPLPLCCPPLCAAPLVFTCPMPTKGCRKRRPKRYPICSGKPRIDKRVYRNGQFMCISYAGHIPGEQYISGRNLPTTTTFAKKRLCRYTPYEFVDPTGCCTSCTF